MMCLMTMFELAERRSKELSEMFREVSGVLDRTDLTAADRHNAQGRLENVSRAMCARSMPRPSVAGTFALDEALTAR